MGSQRVGHDWVTEQQQSWERNPHFTSDNRLRPEYEATRREERGERTERSFNRTERKVMDKANNVIVLMSLCFRRELLFSHPVMSDSLQPHGLQHTRLPCPSLSS